MPTLLPSLLLATALAAKEPPTCVDARPVYHKPTESSEPVHLGIGVQYVEYARRYWM
jgi:hypothetical protein